MINKTIIYTDVVGYSRLTGEDQELALELLSEHDKVLHQNTKHYNGEIIKKTGDGICCIFDDPVNAIKSCIDIQKDLGKRNKMNIKERQVQIRIFRKNESGHYTNSRAPNMALRQSGSQRPKLI